ncbi:MAG: hypothetical protein HYW01_14015 [Deltaproteobacteria bacterium]|nr:hypothetical protein [Deltaproteobacteria bacterium]
MEEIKNQYSETFDSYIRNVDDQELKGVLLKLKNEMRKPDTSWEIIKTVLQSLLNKNKETLIEILPLILK